MRMIICLKLRILGSLWQLPPRKHPTLPPTPIKDKKEERKTSQHENTPKWRERKKSCLHVIPLNWSKISMHISINRVKNITQEKQHLHPFNYIFTKTRENEHGDSIEITSLFNYSEALKIVSRARKRLMMSK